MAIDISHDSATISWTVPSLSYDPEMYTVEYGLTMDNLNLSSAVVTGTVTPLNYADSYQGSVKVEGLEMLTTYFYRVVSMNSAGPTLSAVASFNTSALGNDGDHCKHVNVQYYANTQGPRQHESLFQDLERGKMFL